ncbi:MAG: ankyrin repeat domain-containing protein [Alphaproteobacteria bacterium]
MTATADSFNDNSASPQALGLEMLTELHKSRSECNYTLVRDLINRGASPDVFNDRDQWPLQACICYGHNEIGLLLIEKGADPDLRSPDSLNSPLFLAAHNARVEIVKALLDRGAKLDTPGDQGDTALEEARRLQADNEYAIKEYPDLCDRIKPDPRVTVVKYKTIQTLIQEAADNRAAIEVAAATAKAQRQQADEDWHNEGLPLRQPITVSRRTIKLK